MIKIKYLLGKNDLVHFTIRKNTMGKSLFTSASGNKFTTLHLLRNLQMGPIS